MMAISDRQIAEWRLLFGKGMESAVGEFTPPEFWDAGPDEAWDLREKARKALAPD